MSIRINNIVRLIGIMTIMCLFALIVFAVDTDNFTIQVTVRRLSVRILSGSPYNFGTVYEGTQVVAGTAVVVQNDGNALEDFSLQVTGKPAIWTVKESTGNPGTNEFGIFAVYNSAVPLAGLYTDNDRIFWSAPRNANDGYFASGDQNANDIPVMETRSLWFMFDTPNPSSNYTQQTIIITISASAA